MAIKSSAAEITMLHLDNKSTSFKCRLFVLMFQIVDRQKVVRFGNMKWRM